MGSSANHGDCLAVKPPSLSSFRVHSSSRSRGHPLAGCRSLLLRIVLDVAARIEPLAVALHKLGRLAQIHQVERPVCGHDGARSKSEESLRLTVRAAHAHQGPLSPLLDKRRAERDGGRRGLRLRVLYDEALKVHLVAKLQ